MKNRREQDVIRLERIAALKRKRSSIGVGNTVVKGRSERDIIQAFRRQRQHIWDPRGPKDIGTVVVPARATRTVVAPMTNGAITAITPMGDRHLAFALCQKWMKNQTLQPKQWIIIDDGKVPMKPSIFMEGIFYLRREPQSSDPKYTLLLNLKTALPLIKGSKILIIEDDEYYAPEYIETMAAKLNKYEVVGIGNSKYYHLPSGGNFMIGNTWHASLAQTAFRKSFLPEFEGLLNSRGHFLDMQIWRKLKGSGRGFIFIDNNEPLYVGIKGLPGRRGIGKGHDLNLYRGRNRDTSHKILRNWIPITKDRNIYTDILAGKLTEGNYRSLLESLTKTKDITGITVCCNTKGLIERAYNSVRKFHPDMPIIIIDNSDIGDVCASYVKSLASNLTTVIQLRRNIGHGRGMHIGIDRAKTKYALIFDSDIEMLKSPISQMLVMMEEDTFGIGYIEKTGFDGFEYRAKPHHKKEGWMPYLHPYFQLINIENYRKFYPYVHHGAPCFLTMLDIYQKGLSNKIIKEFPGLGHSSGKGWNWKGEPKEYVRHDTRGTRDDRISKGLIEIESPWERNRGQLLKTKYKGFYKDMKTIAFVTRVHPKRSEFLKVCIDSVKNQTCDDYIHILCRDDKTSDGYGLLLANQSLANIVSIDAKYVMILDDDDMLIDPTFVKTFVKSIKKDVPEIVFFKGIAGGFGILPRTELWGKAPIYTGIASFCFAVRLDIWKKYISEFGKRQFGGDYRFIAHCYDKTANHLWIDRLIAKTQKTTEET